MKRALIWICVILFFIIGVVIFEVVYINGIVSRLDDMLTACIEEQNELLLQEKTHEISKLITKTQTINKMIIPTDRLESIYISLSDMRSYLDLGDITEYKTAASRMKKQLIFIRTAGIFKSLI